MIWIIFVVVVALIIGFVLSQLFYPIVRRPHSRVTTPQGVGATTTSTTSAATAATPEVSLSWATRVVWIVIGLWVGYSAYEYFVSSRSGVKNVSWFNPIAKVSSFYARTFHPFMIDFDAGGWQVTLYKYDQPMHYWSFTVNPKRAWMETKMKSALGADVDEIAITDAISDPTELNQQFSMRGTCSMKAITKECTGKWVFKDTATNGWIGGNFDMQVPKDTREINGILYDEKGDRVYEIKVER